MMTTHDIQYIQAALDILNECVISDEYFSSDEGELYAQELEEYSEEWKEKFEYETGATKLVFIPLDKNENYVLKIPLTHDRDGAHLGGADFVDEDSSWDYCKSECEIYQLAIERGVEEIFVETEFFGFTKLFHPIYVQQKVEMYADISSKKRSSEQITSTRKHCESIDQHPFNEVWLTDCLEYYGEERFDEFMFFLQDKNLDDDLHYGNLGYINGRPVLVDYAGYYG